MDEDLSAALATVGPRLRALRRQRETSLAALAEVTGISVSTLSRLESGLRRPSLELLLPLARAHGVQIDDLIGGPADRRSARAPAAGRARPGMTMIPLSRRPGGVQAYKLIIPDRRSEPSPQAHEGYEWLYVLDGRLRLVLGDQDLVLQPGEAAEFGTLVPHWFGSAGSGPVELLSLFGRQGERAHLRARPAGAGPSFSGRSHFSGRPCPSGRQGPLPTIANRLNRGRRAENTRRRQCDKRLQLVPPGEYVEVSDQQQPECGHEEGQACQREVTGPRAPPAVYQRDHGAEQSGDREHKEQRTGREAAIQLVGPQESCERAINLRLAAIRPLQHDVIPR